MHCLTAWEQWVVQLLQCTAHCLGTVGSATPATHCLTAWGQWIVQLSQCTAPLPFSGRSHPARHSSRAPPWARGAAREGQMHHCLIALG